MEKISGILPPSNRTRSAEISTAQPARPGAPTFGRPEGRNSLGDRVTFSKLAEQMRESRGLGPQQEPLTYQNTSENSKLKVIEELNRKFFSKADPLDRVEERYEVGPTLTAEPEAPVPLSPQALLESHDPQES